MLSLPLTLQKCLPQLHSSKHQPSGGHLQGPWAFWTCSLETWWCISRGRKIRDGRYLNQCWGCCFQFAYTCITLINLRYSKHHSSVSLFKWLVRGGVSYFAWWRLVLVWPFNLVIGQKTDNLFPGKPNSVLIFCAATWDVRCLTDFVWLMLSNCSFLTACCNWSKFMIMLMHPRPCYIWSEVNPYLPLHFLHRSFWVAVTLPDRSILISSMPDFKGRGDDRCRVCCRQSFWNLLHDLSIKIVRKPNLEWKKMSVFSSGFEQLHASYPNANESLVCPP